MEQNEFGLALEQARNARGISRPKLAEVMAGPDAAAKGIEGQLSRFERGRRTPSEKKIIQIADALSSLAQDSDAEKELLLSKLMSLADITITDSDYLRRQCEDALQGVEYLKPHEVQTILAHISVPTMRQFVADAKKPKKITVVQLQNLAAELQKTASRYTSRDAASAGSSVTADHVIPAGRARILIDGEISNTQKRLVRDAANMIKSILET